jgi:hypothetical protein
VNTGAATVPAGVKLTELFVPAGVPPLTAEDVTASPVNVGALFVPAGVPPLTAEVVAPDPVNVGVETVPVGVWVAAPPVVPGSIPGAAPLMNKDRKSGVPFVPSHSSQPLGIADSRPAHMTISPDGRLDAPTG